MATRLVYLVNEPPVEPADAGSCACGPGHDCRADGCDDACPDCSGEPATLETLAIEAARREPLDESTTGELDLAWAGYTDDHALGGWFLPPANA